MKTFKEFIEEVTYIVEETTQERLARIRRQKQIDAKRMQEIKRTGGYDIQSDRFSRANSQQAVQNAQAAQRVRDMQRSLESGGWKSEPLKGNFYSQIISSNPRASTSASSSGSALTNLRGIGTRLSNLRNTRARGGGWGTALSAGATIAAPEIQRRMNMNINPDMVDRASLQNELLYQHGARKPTSALERASELAGTFTPRGGSLSPEKASRLAFSQNETRQSRQRASEKGSFGATSGSGIVGTGGNTIVSKPSKPGGASFISTGGGNQRRTAQLQSTQLVRDPRTGKQVVGDLAFKGGKPTYLARAPIATRHSDIGSQIMRTLNIGPHTNDAMRAAAKNEYRIALKNTQNYQRQLGTSPQRATELKLPGRGVGPTQKRT